MNFRIWVLLIAALSLIALAGCGGIGPSRGPAATPIPTKTLRPTFTSTPVRPTAVPPTATPLPIPTVTSAPPTPTAPPPTVAPTAAPPTATATPEKAAFTVSEPAVNVRGGPGVNYPILGEVRQGQTFDITGKNPNGDWWQFIYEGRTGWITAGMVTARGTARVQVAANIPAPPTSPPPPPTTPPQPTNTPAPALRYAMTGKSQLRPNTNDFVTVWCFVFNQAGTALVPGTLRVTRDGAVIKEQAYSGGPEPARGDSGYPSEFLYNPGCKAEIQPALNGNYSAFIIQGGQQVSDVFNFTVSGVTNRIAIIEWKEK
jgi:hypothetical protein